jgi:uncharacterized protein (TIGR02270 family)
MNAATSAPRLSDAYLDIYEQFAVDSSFLWLLRSIAVNQPHYAPGEIGELETRIDANLDGLMTAPEESWAICRDALELGEPGEAFTAAILAFRSLDAHKIQTAVEAGLSTGTALPGLVSALGWLPGRLCHSWIKRFLTSKDLEHKYLAVAACSVRREDPKEYLSAILKRPDCLAHTDLHARALRLVGELKRQDLIPAVKNGLKSEDPTVVFWAAWAAVMLGYKAVATEFHPYIMQPGPLQGRAIDLAFRVLPVGRARSWIAELAKDPVGTRNVIKAISALGDPHAINWLIDQMRVPKFSRQAGEAFTFITGIQLEENNLALDDLPNLDAHLPNDDPRDEDVSMDEDENLPFPDVAKLAATWQKYQHRFVSGQRYVLGKAIAAEHVAPIVETGLQRQRKAAALELALLDPHTVVPNCKARSMATS